MIWHPRCPAPASLVSAQCLQHNLTAFTFQVSRLQYISRQLASLHSFLIAHWGSQPQVSQLSVIHPVRGKIVLPCCST